MGRGPGKTQNPYKAGQCQMVMSSMMEIKQGSVTAKGVTTSYWVARPLGVRLKGQLWEEQVQRLPRGGDLKCTRYNKVASAGVRCPSLRARNLTLGIL